MRRGWDRMSEGYGSESKTPSRAVYMLSDGAGLSRKLRADMAREQYAGEGKMFAEEVLSP